MPQDVALYPTLSARANLSFFGQIYGLHGRELRQRVEDVLRIVSLSERADEAIETYSGGMKRRINIAAGLVHQPELLFLDEPTVGVDTQSRNAIFESVRQLNRERGMSIIYTSHYMEEVELLCVSGHHRPGKIIAMDTIEPRRLLGGGLIQMGVSGWMRICSQPEPATGIKAVDVIPAATTDDPSPLERGRQTQPRSPRSIHARRSSALSPCSTSRCGPHLARDPGPSLESVFLRLTGRRCGTRPCG